MTSAPDHEQHAEHVPAQLAGRAGDPRFAVKRTTAMIWRAAWACGARRRLRRLEPPSGPGGARLLKRADGQVRGVRPCMRSHGIPDFPDPTTSPAGSGRSRSTSVRGAT